MMWGNIETWTSEGYGASNIKQVREVINRMINLFERYDVKATFATVGLIMQKPNSESLFPEKLPTYKRKELSPYHNNFINRIKSADESLYFGLDIIERLKRLPNIEIGSHTYGHYYCWEKGQTLSQFEADIKKAIEVAKENGIDLKSIVFPCNQIDLAYLEICSKYGITSYRGTPMKYFGKSNSKFTFWKNRLCRLIDSYINLGGPTTFSLDDVKDSNKILNIRASRFLRPYSKRLAFLEGLKLRRIKNEMNYAVRHNEIYHLWWHPHNFGSNMEENFNTLEKILKYYSLCHNRWGMQSLTMKDFSVLSD
ncbi:MAG: polysaccharide deacetylase family protein [Prevotella sp.]|jgi:peptidoglycan/xylan/chitin deacetylase (PgdA/CDA1 family)